jgi:hypothetical protein
VMALGLLRLFDAERNSAVPNQSPQCSFDNNPIMQGIQRLDQHGPLAFEVRTPLQLASVVSSRAMYAGPMIPMVLD